MGHNHESNWVLNLPPHVKRLSRVLAVKQLVADGHKSIALYGAGQHTKRLLEEMAGNPDITVSVILDDAVTEKGEKFGLPLLSPKNLNGEPVDAVLLSSDAYEDALWESSKGLRDRDLPVYRIYKPASFEASDAHPEEEHDSYEKIFQAHQGNNPETYHMRDGLSKQNAITYFRYSRKHIHDRLYKAMEPYLKPGSVILDVGSGWGYDTNRMSIRFPQARVLGLEYAHSGVERARQFENERLRFQQGDATNMELEDESVDMAYSLAVIEHVNDPSKMVEEIFRVLKPGGCALVATHPEKYFTFWFERDFKAAQEAGIEYDFHGMRKEDLAALLADAGFLPVEMNYAGFVFPQKWLKHLQVFDFNRLFALQALAGWCWRGVGMNDHLYYQYHLVQKPGGETRRKEETSLFVKTKRALHKIAATPLFRMIQPAIIKTRDRCAWI